MVSSWLLTSPASSAPDRLAADSVLWLGLSLLRLSLTYLSYSLSCTSAWLSCSRLAGISTALAHCRLQAQCWNGTQVLPR